MTNAKLKGEAQETYLKQNNHDWLKKPFPHDCPL